MSEHTKKHHTDKNQYHVIITGPDEEEMSHWISEQSLIGLKEVLEKTSKTESVDWDVLAADRISKYGKAGLALRGARAREGLSQKELAKRSNVCQENISRMENGKRLIGPDVAQKLAKALNIDSQLLVNDPSLKGEACESESEVDQPQSLK
jgi:ribosome-binding protein aMBF1 (putative translation factor)